VLPPLLGVAVKVSDEPAQLGFVPVVKAIVTDGVTLEVLLIVIEFEVAVADVAQVALEVNIHATISPLANVVLVNVALLVPALVPFTVH
jgi:hypothetical protein